MSLRQRLVAALVAGLVASPLYAQDHGAGVTEAFAQFEDRCVQALRDPDAYFEMVRAEEPGTRFAAASEDEAFRVSLPADMESAENVSIATGDRLQRIGCITGYYLADPAEQPALVAAVKSFIDSRADLTLSAGGQITLPEDASDHVMAGISFWQWLVSGLTVPEETLVYINVGPDHFELSGERVVPTAGNGG